MRAHGVVDLFPLAEFAVEFFHLQGASGDLVELLGVGAVGAFDGAVEFGRTRRQHEQAQATLLAELLEPRCCSDDKNPSRPDESGPPGSTLSPCAPAGAHGEVLHHELAFRHSSRVSLFILNGNRAVYKGVPFAEALLARPLVVDF